MALKINFYPFFDERILMNMFLDERFLMNMFINEQFSMNMFNDERFSMNMVFDERYSMNMLFDERFSVERRPTQISRSRACQATLHAGQQNLFSFSITVVQRFWKS